ncbi:hypothetical protein ACKWTF_014726 [Chironomus riparius]
MQEPKETLENSQKICEISNEDSKKQENATSCQLPMELIIHIISFQNTIQDLHNCMLISKEIRDSIFKTPEIMRKVLINFRECSWVKIQTNQPNESNLQEPTSSNIETLLTEPHLEFLENKGKFFRCLELNVDENNSEAFKFIMNRVENLEDLNFEVIESQIELQEANTSHEDIPDLKRLKAFKINHNALKFFVKNTKNAKNLQNFTVIAPKIDSQEVLTDFIVLQDNLKEFTLKLNTAMDIINFPTRDITKEVKFKLKKLNLCFVNSNRKHFMDFLKSQAPNLKELELNYKPHHEILDIVFRYCTKLTNLSLNTYGDSPVFSDLYPHWQLPNLKRYSNKSFSAVQLDKVYIRFPNVESLVAFKMLDNNGTYNKLKTLEVGLLYYNHVQHLKLPELKSFKISLLSGDGNDKTWINLAKNFENLENLTVKDFQWEHDVMIVVQNLSIFKNLKTFKLGSLKRIGYASAMGVVLTTFKDQQFFNMIIDIERKIIKYSRFIEVKFPEIFDVLMDNFENFKFVEYNVYKPRKVEECARNSRYNNKVWYFIKESN